MKTGKLIRVAGLGVILWGAGVVAMNTRGYASCVPETGFSGFLHKAFFAPAATCKVNSNGTCQTPGAICTLTAALSPSGNRNGTCATQANKCVCVATPQ